jgi:hypothetical protein
MMATLPLAILIDTIGAEATRQVMLRFGYADGLPRRRQPARSIDRCGPTRSTGCAPASPCTAWKVSSAPKFFRSITTRPPDDSKRNLERVREAVHREVQALERRERQVAKRERELNLPECG